MADVLQTLAAAPTPATDPMGSEARKAQYRIAELLSQQGMSTEPIQHWTQGLARLAQAGFGGWDRSLLDKEEKSQTAAYRKLMDQDPRLATGETPAPQDRVATALAGPSTTNTAATYGMTPASIRNNNPGAMWPGPSSAAYGSTGSQNVAGNNKIASFSDPVAGASAQFDLLNRNYTNMSMADAIKKWSGGNNVDAYTQGVVKATGLLPDTMITPEFLKSPQGISLARAMARHEAGRDYPLSPEQWAQAQGRAFAGVAPAGAPAPAAGGAVPQQAQQMPGVAPQSAVAAPAADPGVPPVAAPQAGPAAVPAQPGAPQSPQLNRVPTQMTPQIAQYIRQLRATNNPAALAQAEALTQQYSKPTEYDFKVVGDELYKTDKLGNAVPVAAANKKPHAIEEVEYAKKNWQALGFPDPAALDVKSRMFWQEYNAKRLGGAGVNVQIDQSAPNEFEKTYGEGMGKRAIATVEAGDKATTQLQRVQIVQKLQQGLQTGKLTDATSTVGGWLLAAGVDPSKFGIDPKLPMTAEALNSLTNELVIGKIGAGGFPANNFSDADRKFLTGAVFAMADRPEANYIKTEVARRLAEFDAEKANAWAEARSNKTSYEQFERDWRKKMQSQDMFGDLIEQAKAFGAQPGQQGGPIDQTKMRQGLEQQFGGAQPAYNAAVEEAKRRGWKIPGLTQ